MNNFETPAVKESRKLQEFVAEMDANTPQYIKDFEDNRTFEESRILAIKFEIPAYWFNALKNELQTKTNQDTMTKLIQEFTGWEYEHKQTNSTRIKKKDNEMGRPTKSETERKKSISISLTAKEAIALKGQFQSVGRGARFLMNLMEDAYGLGLLPDSLIEKHMKAVK